MGMSIVPVLTLVLKKVPVFSLIAFLLLFKDDVAGCFEFYADLAEKLNSKQKAPVSLPMETFKSYVLKEPIGVVGLITP